MKASGENAASVGGLKLVDPSSPKLPEFDPDPDEDPDEDPDDPPSAPPMSVLLCPPQATPTATTVAKANSALPLFDATIGAPVEVEVETRR
jgi:hypothetical protein